MLMLLKATGKLRNWLDRFDRWVLWRMLGKQPLPLLVSRQQIPKIQYLCDDEDEDTLPGGN